MRFFPFLCESLFIALILSTGVQAQSGDDVLEALKKTLNEVMPKPAVFRLHDLPSGVLLRGTVASRQDADLAEQIAESYFPRIINEIDVVMTSSSLPGPALSGVT